MLPCRSSSVCILMAALCSRNLAQGNNQRRRSMVVETRSGRTHTAAAMQIDTCAPVMRVVGIGQRGARHAASLPPRERSGRKFSNWEKTVRPWFTHDWRPRGTSFWPCRRSNRGNPNPSITLCTEATCESAKRVSRTLLQVCYPAASGSSVGLENARREWHNLVNGPALMKSR